MTESKDQHTLKGCVVLIVIIIAGYFGCKACGKSLDESTAKHQIEEADRMSYLKVNNHAEWRKEMFKAQLSGWDHSHKNLTVLIKSAMNDPGSFEHIETTYTDKIDYFLVKQEYSGKNAFGGRVRGYVLAKVDVNGNIIEIVDQK